LEKLLQKSHSWSVSESPVDSKSFDSKTYVLPRSLCCLLEKSIYIH
jgi:hypothetical protein